MRLADRLQNLGTETAFAVADMAAQWRAKGKRVFPFHLGDIDLPPPAAIVEAAARAIADGYNGYCPGAGIPLLREQIARVLGEERGIEIHPDNVSAQPGGKPVIGKFLAAVANPGDEVLYPVPGFPIYESQIRYLGATPAPYRYRPRADGGFGFSPAEIRAAVTPKTRALIFNDYHNPTGAAASAADLAAVAQIAVDNDLWVLSDEAYAAVRYEAPFRSLAACDGMAERTTILFTCSKGFAMTGWRLGAAVGPKAIIAAISNLNTNIESCTTHFIQRAVGECLRDGAADSEPVRRELLRRRDALVAALNAIDGIEVAPPPSGFYVCADIGEILRRKGLPDADALMRESLRGAGVSFCTGAHFGESPATRHIRFAFSGLPTAAIEEGIAALGEWIEK